MLPYLELFCAGSQLNLTRVMNELMRCKGRVSETEKAASSEMLCDQKAQRGYTIGVTVGECYSLISWLLTSDRAAPQLAECEAGI